MPRRVCPRVTVEQEDGRSRAAMAHAKDYVAEVDPIQCEAVEHGCSLRCSIAFSRGLAPQQASGVEYPHQPAGTSKGSA